MKRILLITLFILLAAGFSAYARAEEQTVEKSMAFTIKLAGDEAAASDMVNAMLFIHALKAMGGEIHFEGDNVVIKLDLSPEKVDALRLALEQGGFPLAHVPGTIVNVDRQGYEHDYTSRTPRRGSHERFLLGKKGGGSCQDFEGKKVIVKVRDKDDVEVFELGPESGYRIPPGGDIRLWKKGKMPEGRYFFGKMPEMPEMKCPHCGKTFRPDMPMMMMPHPPMPPMPPSGGEFKREMMPGGPMPYGGMMPGMGPMHEDTMKQLQGLREEMEQMRAEQGELWKALKELHQQLGQMHEMDRAKCEDLDALWRALDKLYAELDEEDED